LRPEDVDVLVFWTRNPRPLFPHLAELDRRGYRYYFQYTLLDNPRAIDPKSPPVEAGMRTLRELAERIGPRRVIWRYDPIVLSEQTPPAYHAAAHARIAAALAGCTERNVISIVDIYRKAQGRLRQLRNEGITVQEVKPNANGAIDDAVGDMLRQMAEQARAAGMEIVSCAEEADLLPYGIAHGKCIDDEYIARTFGLRLKLKKDPSQRPACGCVASKDIGMYDTCPFGCQYCYATSSFDTARRNHAAHDPQSAALVGWYDIPSVSSPAAPGEDSSPSAPESHSSSCSPSQPEQLNLF